VKRKRRQIWADYFALVGEGVGLRDWQFLITETTATDEESKEGVEHVLAHVDAIFGQQTARITLAPDFDEYSPEDLRRCVVHELVHCQFAQAALYANHVFWEVFHPSMAAWHDRIFTYLMEFGVDGCARALMPYVPLPSDAFKELRFLTKNRRRDVDNPTGRTHRKGPDPRFEPEPEGPPAGKKGV
jgi:hypothetical protein